ncbi:hypothetical protein [Neptunomonas japonica]|uniref:hypothetical protein n=1 Tax=Neptunomonas japonica TaxID=417574 RepID=UPI001914E962|nr:hypothetical protein [Neptunomonas japonica]
MLLLAIAMLFGRPPIYRPKRMDVYCLISDLCEGEGDADQWVVFVGLTILHDPELEKIRLRCYDLELLADGHQEILFGSGRYRYNNVGMDRLKEIRSALKALMDQEPSYRSF